MFDTLLHKAFKENSYTMDPGPFVQYLQLMQKWNRVFNLTAITAPQEMVMLHIMDSLAINPFLQGVDILDVGTGAGLPGIPLALINPEKNFFLLDSNSKKTRFLTQVVTELALKNVTVIHSRCEDFQTKNGFDSIMSRAFASLQVMLTSTQHLLAVNGEFLAMKGVLPQDELKQLPQDFKVMGVEEISIKGLTAARCVVRITKNSLVYCN